MLREVGGHQPFVTHVEVHPPDGKPYLIWGHYYGELERAFADFENRCQRYGVREIR